MPEPTYGSLGEDGNNNNVDLNIEGQQFHFQGTFAAKATSYPAVCISGLDSCLPTDCKLCLFCFQAARTNLKPLQRDIGSHSWPR